MRVTPNCRAPLFSDLSVRWWVLWAVSQLYMLWCSKHLHGFSEADTWAGVAHPPTLALSQKLRMSLAGMEVNCTCSVTAASCEEFFTNQLSISWQISTTEYICLGNVKWSGRGQFSWIKPAHPFIIHQTAGVSVQKKRGGGKIPNFQQPYLPLYLRINDRAERTWWV